MKIRVFTYVKPTEDVNKVKTAVENIYSGELMIVEEDKDLYRIEGYSDNLNSLSKLRDLIRSKQIVPATRSYLVKRVRGNTLTIVLHKQAAYMKNVSLIDSDRESPLGAIWIEIEAENTEEIIEWLAPRQFIDTSRSRESRTVRDTRKRA